VRVDGRPGGEKVPEYIDSYRCGNGYHEEYMEARNAEVYLIEKNRRKTRMGASQDKEKLIGKGGTAGQGGGERGQGARAVTGGYGCLVKRASQWGVGSTTTMHCEWQLRIQERTPTQGGEDKVRATDRAARYATGCQRGEVTRRTRTKVTEKTRPAIQRPLSGKREKR